MTAAKTIGVLTFHRCINYGSYWQARSLVEGLRARGHQAELLDHDCPEVRRAEWTCAFQPQLPLRTPRDRLRAHGRKARSFLEAFDRLPQSPRFSLFEPEAAGRYDVVLVGSDEVWNFRHPWYSYKPIFFGERVQADRLASYAASFGNHDAHDGIDPHWREKLGRFDAISVRDENSRTLVRDGVGVEPDIVLDPCLQFPPSAEPYSAGEPYLALYGHGFPDWFARTLRKAADDRGWRIVSIGYDNDWADEQAVEVTPEEFPARIAGAAAVATNFFHGCVFALAMDRPFVCTSTPYRRNKLRDLTAKLGAEAHLIDEDTPLAVVEEQLDQPIDRAIIARIAELRAQSSAYLDRAIG
jgi:hypothetical protein